MKKILFFILIITFISCKKENERSDIKTEVNHSNVVTINSDSLATHFKFNDDLFEYEIIGLQDSAKFTADEISFPLKENDFDYSKSTDLDYFTAKTFDIAKNKFKIVVFNTYGDNDSKILNIQLNSYTDNKLIDAILLDSRFTFETEYYRNFKINGNDIEIKKVSVEKLLFNEEGDIVGDKKVNDTLTDIVKYKIDSKGLFIKQ